MTPSISMMGLFLAVSVPVAASSMELARCASGGVPIAQLTTLPSKQSTTGERYTLPVGSWNSVMSVTYYALHNALSVMRPYLGTI